ncbi:MAG: GHKL domain-containing protein [Roseburia sp.]
MLFRIALTMEIFSVILCVHCIYGKNVRLHMQTILLFLELLVLLDFANAFQAGAIFSVFCYPMIFLYCRVEFKEPLGRTFLKMLLTIVILTMLQFLCMLPASILVPENEGRRLLLGSAMVLCICIGILPRWRMDQRYRIYRIREEERGVALAVIIFIVLVIALLLLQGKLLKEIHMENFIFTIPSLALLLVLIRKWAKLQENLNAAMQELSGTAGMQEKYQELLVKVRLRQHAFKNHLAAILGAHYTYKTYEELVENQKIYCKKLQDENIYNELLRMENGILAGFFYGKFQEAEEDGVRIAYKVAVGAVVCGVPTHHLIEMLGILFDNAVEAEQGRAEKRIFISITESLSRYIFLFRNLYEPVSYQEIEEWFGLGASRKGVGRGIGLYHLKRLCGEWNCEIGCRNTEMDGENWIEFRLEIRKTDSC